MSSTALLVVEGETRRWEDHLDLVRKLAAPHATDDEFELFLYRARACGLDPLARHIYFVRHGSVGHIVVGIDGLRLIADRTGAYAGSDDVEFMADTDTAHPSRARATVYKVVNGMRCAFAATARWDEFFPSARAGEVWSRLPFLMLGKCAEAQALRKAFPAETAGLVAPEELGTPPPVAMALGLPDTERGCADGPGSQTA